MTLPLSPEELRDYNNVPTTPVSQKLGDTINALVGGGGGTQPFAEVYNDVGFIAANVDDAGYKDLDVLGLNGVSSGLTPNNESITLTPGRYRCVFQCNVVRPPPPAVDLSVTLAFGIGGVAVPATAWTVSDNFASTQSMSMSAILHVPLGADLTIMGLGVDPPPGVSVEFFNARLQAFRLGDAV